MSTLAEKLWARVRAHEKKSEEYKISPPRFDEWYERLLEVYRAGFRCEYCGRAMKLEGEPDDPDLWTIDHKKSLRLGGDNSAGNIAIVCNRCNRAKGVLPHDLYVKLVDAVRRVYGEEVLDQILYYLSISGKAKKVEAWKPESTPTTKSSVKTLRGYTRLPSGAGSRGESGENQDDLRALS